MPLKYYIRWDMCRHVDAPFKIRVNLSYTFTLKIITAENTWERNPAFGDT